MRLVIGAMLEVVEVYNRTRGTIVQESRVRAFTR